MFAVAEIEVPESRGSRGNFEEVRLILDRLGKPPMTGSGETSGPTKRLCDKLARCPAAHNRALLDRPNGPHAS